MLNVAPHAGAWIETYTFWLTPGAISVAPHAGAWIETSYYLKLFSIGSRRPPCGGVD